MSDPDKTEALEDQLLSIKSDLPSANLLTQAEKLTLMNEMGPGSVRSILKAKRDLPLERIPFLFSSLDSQKVIDILHNDWEDVLPARQTRKKGRENK